MKYLFNFFLFFSYACTNAQNDNFYKILIQDVKSHVITKKKFTVKNITCGAALPIFYKFTDSLNLKKDSIFIDREMPQELNINIPFIRYKNISIKENGKQFNACLIQPILFHGLIFSGIMIKDKSSSGGIYINMLYSIDYKLISISRTSVSHMNEIK